MPCSAASRLKVMRSAIEPRTGLWSGVLGPSSKTPTTSNALPDSFVKRSAIRKAFASQPTIASLRVNRRSTAGCCSTKVATLRVTTRAAVAETNHTNGVCRRRGLLHPRIQKTAPCARAAIIMGGTRDRSCRMVRGNSGRDARRLRLEVRKKTSTATRSPTTSTSSCRPVNRLRAIHPVTNVATSTTVPSNQRRTLRNAGWEERGAVGCIAASLEASVATPESPCDVD